MKSIIPILWILLVSLSSLAGNDNKEQQLSALGVVVKGSPVSDELVLENTNSRHVGIKVYDLTGRLVLNGNLPAETEMKQDVRHLEKGVYLLKFDLDKQAAAVKVMKL